MVPESINWHGTSRADSREGADSMAEQTYIKILDPVNYSRMVPLQCTVTVAILSVYNVVCVLAVDVFYVLFSFTRSSSNV